MAEPDSSSVPKSSGVPKPQVYDLLNLLQCFHVAMDAGESCVETARRNKAGLLFHKEKQIAFEIIKQILRLPFGKAQGRFRISAGSSRSVLPRSRPQISSNLKPAPILPRDFQRRL